MAEGLIEIVGDMPLFASPGTAAEGTRTLESEGRHVAICFIPQGVTDMAILEQIIPGSNPEDRSPESEAIMANPPHLALGMIQEFTVTPAGTEFGPLPEAASHEMAADEGSAPEDEEAASESSSITTDLGRVWPMCQARSSCALAWYSPARLHAVVSATAGSRSAHR